MSMAEDRRSQRAQAGDWIEVAGLPGKQPRRGQITEVLGVGDHEHYRVRWDSRHESVFFPTEGVHVLGPDRVPQASA